MEEVFTSLTEAARDALMVAHTKAAASKHARISEADLLFGLGTAKFGCVARWFASSGIDAGRLHAELDAAPHQATRTVIGLSAQVTSAVHASVKRARLRRLRNASTVDLLLILLENHSLLASVAKAAGTDERGVLNSITSFAASVDDL